MVSTSSLHPAFISSQAFRFTRLLIFATGNLLVSIVKLAHAGTRVGLKFRLAGHAINRREQLSLRHSDTELGPNASSTIAGGGLWAPTIRYHDGTTYIICTNVVFQQGRTISSRQNFIIHTTDIANCIWSDPKYFDFDGIDPSIFFDDDGRTYVQLCSHPRGGIWQFEIDLKTVVSITPPTLLWDGWDRRFTEGPHIYKKDGYYYLLVAEGGTFETHMVSMARSRDIRGPFEPCPSNPLITGPLNGELHHVGHGDFFQDKQGDWWTVLLAVRRVGNFYPLGRESFVTRVVWPAGEWPRISKIFPTQAPTLLKDRGYVHLRDAILENYSVRNDEVRIRPSPVELYGHKDSPSFAGRRQLAFCGEASVTLQTNPGGSLSLKAGLCVYKDEHRYAAIGLNFDNFQVYFEGRNKALGYSANAMVSVSACSLLHFKVTYSRDEMVFACCPDNSDEQWIKVGIVDTADLCGRDFVGPIIGMFAIGADEARNCEVVFMHIEI